MKLKIALATLSLLALNLWSIPTSKASAGWYPTFPGDIIETNVCLPKKHGPVIYLQLTRLGSDFKTVAKFKPNHIYDPKYCGKGKSAYGYNWKVKVTGEWGIVFYDLTYKKHYIGWPDGIESH